MVSISQQHGYMKTSLGALSSRARRGSSLSATSQSCSEPVLATWTLRTPSVLPMVALHMFPSPSPTPAHQSIVPQSAHNMDAMYSRRHTRSHALVHAASLSVTHGLSRSGGLLAAFQQPWTSSGADNKENCQWAAPYLLQPRLKPRLGRAPFQVSLPTLRQPEDTLWSSIYLFIFTPS